MKYPGLNGREARLAEVLALLLKQAGDVAAAPASVDVLLEVADRATTAGAAAPEPRTYAPTAHLPRGPLSTDAARRKLNDMGFDKVDASDSEMDAAWTLSSRLRKQHRLFLWAPADLGSWLPEGQRQTLTEQIVSYVENEAESGNPDLANALGAVLGVSMSAAPTAADALATTSRALDMLGSGANFNQVVEETGVTAAVSQALAQARAAAEDAPPVVVVLISGGTVNSISATHPADVIVLDDDLETSDPDDLTRIGNKTYRVTELAAITRPGSSTRGSDFVADVLAGLCGAEATRLEHVDDEPEEGDAPRV
jgi:hypothetical protein